MNEGTAPTTAEKIAVCGIELHGISVGVLWLLEEIKSPLYDGASVGRPLNTGDTARVIYCLAYPKEARKALSKGPTELDSAAHALAMTISPGDLNEIVLAIGALFRGNLAAAEPEGTQ